MSYFLSGPSTIAAISGLGAYAPRGARFRPRFARVGGLGALGITSAELGTKMATGSWCGSSSSKNIQAALNDLGFPLKVDGIWGSGSMAALNAFGATVGIAKASFPTSAHCVALKNALAQKEAAAAQAAAAAAAQQTGGGGTTSSLVDGTAPAPTVPPQPGTDTPAVDKNTMGGEETEGMSTMTMVGIGAVVVVALGLGVYVATRP